MLAIAFRILCPRRLIMSVLNALSARRLADDLAQGRERLVSLASFATLQRAAAVAVARPRVRALSVGTLLRRLTTSPDGFKPG
jgi:hypothetical protein